MYLHKLKIGNVELENNIILAPMAGISDLPFRIICKKFGPGLTCTEMVSSKALYHDSYKTKKMMNVENEKRPIKNLQGYYFVNKHNINKSEPYELTIITNYG